MLLQARSNKPSENSTFQVSPPSCWVASYFPFALSDVTNNQAEFYHHFINTLFKQRPTAKKAVQLVRRIEKYTRDNKIHELQNVTWPSSNDDVEEDENP